MTQPTEDRLRTFREVMRRERERFWKAEREKAKLRERLEWLRQQRTGEKPGRK